MIDISFKPKKTIETSKQIYKFTKYLTSLVTLFTMVMIWRTEDMSPLVYLIPAVFGAFATSAGFYYWKAKAENLVKLKITASDVE